MNELEELESMNIILNGIVAAAIIAVAVELWRFF